VICGRACRGGRAAMLLAGTGPDQPSKTRRH
jgi:hypothetical protein